MVRIPLFPVLLCSMIAGALLESAASPPADSVPEIILEPGTEDLSADSAARQEPDITRMPEVIKRSAPVYPPQCARNGVEGTVVLDCVVSDSGTVDSVAVVKSVHPLLDSSAVAALRKFRFSPAYAGNEPVPVLLQYEMPFALTEVTSSIQKVANFHGQLRESGTRNPIADAMVVLSFPDSLPAMNLGVPLPSYLERIGSFDGQHLEENRLVTLTDSTGHFTFYSLPPCSVHISSPLPGYEVFRQAELIKPAEELTALYYIKKVSYDDYEIVVYGKTEEKEISRRQLTLNEVKKLPGLGNDAIRVIQAMPGVARPSFGSGDIIVRGAPSWDSRYFLDGTTLPLLYHFGGLKSVYNSDALGSIDFYPGGFSTRYGGAIAGIIEIKGREAKRDRWHGQIDMNLIDGAVFVEGPVNDKVSLLASARRSFVGDIISWYVKNNQDRFPYSVAPYYYDMLARVDVALSKNDRLFFTLLHSRDSLGIFVPSVQGGSSEVSDQTDALGTKIQFTTLQAGWDCKLTAALSNSLRYAVTKPDFDMSVFGYVKVNEHPWNHYFRNELTWTISPVLQLSGGGDIELQQENLILQIPSASGIVNRDTTNNWWFGVVGAYANLTVRPTENFQIQPGIRYDYYPELIHNGGIVPEFWNYSFINNNRGFSGDPSLRISARYKVNERQTLKAAVGNYNQSPQPIGQVIHKTWGDPSIPTTKAAHYLAGIEWRITDLISADLQGYINRQWEIPRMADNIDQKEHPGALWLADDKGKMKGLELMLRHEDNGRFFGWIAYTLSRSERWNPHDNRYYLYQDDETHHLQLVASWHLPREWDLGTRIRYVTGKPSTPVAGIFEDENSSSIIPLNGKENSERIAPFFQIDLRVDKKFVYRTWMFSAYVDIQNLSWFFYRSPEMEVYNYDYSDKQPVSMVILPAVGLKAEF